MTIKKFDFKLFSFVYLMSFLPFTVMMLILGINPLINQIISDFKIALILFGGFAFPALVGQYTLRSGKNPHFKSGESLFGGK